MSSQTNPQAIKFILTRHSETVHNIKKTQIQQHANTSSDNKYKQSQQYINFKFSPEFIDREEINIQEVNQVKEKHDMSQIGLVIVSPLNRCLLTAKQLGLEGIKIIAEPLLASRINSAWSFGKSLRQKKLKHPYADFSHCQDQNIHWCIDVLMQDSTDFQLFYNQKKYQIPDHQLLILEYLKHGKSQSYTSIINRALKFKQKLFSTYTKQCDANKKILIISHSNVLKVLTAGRINEKGKAKSKFQFNHIEFVPVEQAMLIPDDIFDRRPTEPSS